MENDDGSFLLDTRRGVYWHLNPAGLSLVSGLSHGLDLEGIVQQTLAEYDVDAQTVRDDFANLIGDLKRARLIEERG